MRRMLEKIMDCYGSTITLTREEDSRVIRGFLQRSGEKTPELSRSALGGLDRGSYVYLGMTPLAEGDTLEAEGTAYLVRQAESILGRDGPLYYWGLCVRKGAEDTWGS